MASLTVRDLDDALKASLRMRAATNSRSMEEEVRQILRAALAPPAQSGANLFDQIRSRFKGLGDVHLEIPPREPARDPPDFSNFVVPKRARKQAAKPPRPARQPKAGSPSRAK